MRPSISFLIDENLPSDVLDVLQQLGYACLYVRHSTYRGAADAVIAQLAAEEHRILITRDLDFLLRGPNQPEGLILLRVPPTYTRQEIGRLVTDFLAASDLNRVIGHVASVRPGRAPRYRPLMSSAP